MSEKNKNTFSEALKNGGTEGLIVGVIFGITSGLINSSWVIALSSGLGGFVFGFLHGSLDELIHSNQTVSKIFYGSIFVLIFGGLFWAYVANFSEMKLVLKIVAPIGIILLFGVVGTIYYFGSGPKLGNERKDK